MTFTFTGGQKDNSESRCSSSSTSYTSDRDHLDLAGCDWTEYRYKRNSGSGCLCVHFCLCVCTLDRCQHQQHVITTQRSRVLPVTKNFLCSHKGLYRMGFYEASACMHVCETERLQLQIAMWLCSEIGEVCTWAFGTPYLYPRMGTSVPSMYIQDQITLPLSYQQPINAKLQNLASRS